MDLQPQSPDPPDPEPELEAESEQPVQSPHPHPLEQVELELEVHPDVAGPSHETHPSGEAEDSGAADSGHEEVFQQGEQMFFFLPTCKCKALYPQAPSMLVNN